MSFILVSLFLSPHPAHAWFERFKVPVATQAPKVEVMPTPGLWAPVYRMVDEQQGITCYIVGQTSTDNSSTISCVKTAP